MSFSYKLKIIRDAKSKRHKRVIKDKVLFLSASSENRILNAQKSQNLLAEMKPFRRNKSLPWNKT